LKKPTNLSSQSAQYVKKTDKDFVLKKCQFWVKKMKKIHVKKENKSEQKKHVGKTIVF
jgi:hypothetical protein